ncbi:MAG: hypothetical protein P4L56_20415 [Candidatus Sulfopaludibacter sp.]|nr:hypothetical protein [Candidatus Sulfopaludibacter sp.]
MRKLLVTACAIAGSGLIALAGQEPPLAGPGFMARWDAKTTKDLSARIKEAPPQLPPKSVRQRPSRQPRPNLRRRPQDGQQPSSPVHTQGSGSLVHNS